ncbi:pullulanase/glycogen debranching enzyme [Cryobacterium sp. CAN_C3]|uniref:hypothetical protein n=1 Tax=unclassified Cryobacterium TaxID=2649013 RepID=UPI0018C961CC|nr:hypothetical protein [Cryobacterium sp. CAN_C3]MEC5155971.1 pullulanase/glycogen debranching enzyme [Cryobacterium sp. CAN_C3]
MGATYAGTGTIFALFSEAADRVELCLFADDGVENRIEVIESSAFQLHIDTGLQDQETGSQVSGWCDSLLH